MTKTTYIRHWWKPWYFNGKFHGHNKQFFISHVLPFADSIACLLFACKTANEISPPPPSLFQTPLYHHHPQISTPSKVLFHHIGACGMGNSTPAMENSPVIIQSSTLSLPYLQLAQRTYITQSSGDTYTHSTQDEWPNRNNNWSSFHNNI